MTRPTGELRRIAEIFRETGIVHPLNRAWEQGGTNDRVMVVDLENVQGKADRGEYSSAVFLFLNLFPWLWKKDVEVTLRRDDNDGKYEAYIKLWADPSFYPESLSGTEIHVTLYGRGETVADAIQTNTVFMVEIKDDEWDRRGFVLSAHELYNRAGLECRINGNSHRALVRTPEETLRWIGQVYQAEVVPRKKP